MKTFFKLFILIIVTLLISSCNNVTDSPVATNTKVQTDIIDDQPTFRLRMVVVQNSDQGASTLFDDGITFSDPMYGCSDDIEFITPRGGSGITYDVYCYYSWTNCTATYIAGAFQIFNWSYPFNWLQYRFCTGQSNGSNNYVYYNVGMESGRTYYARLCNGYFDEYEVYHTE